MAGSVALITSNTRNIFGAGHDCDAEDADGAVEGDATWLSEVSDSWTLVGN